MKKIILFFLLALSFTACSNSAVIYYLDATKGNDSQKGTSPKTAWKSLDKLKSIQLNPGDKVLFKRGEIFHGELNILAQGTPDKRVEIGAYSNEQQKPCIVGNDTSMYAVRIINSDYLTLQDIEIVNTGKAPMPYRTGLRIECTNYGISHNIIVRNLTIRDVNGSLVKEKGGGSGIYIVNGGNDKISVFNRLTIENCHILRCSRNAMIWDAYSDRSNWHPSKHTLIRGNLIEEVPGDGIVPIGCDSTLIEYNVMRNSPSLLPDTEAAAGIWPWSCDNTVIQFNEVSDHKAPWDAQGFDSDWNCIGTIIQYNYSHDNDGGMVLICNDGGASKTFSAGNEGTIVRYNVSINDGRRTRSTRVGMFSPNIHLAGPVKNSKIVHNIIHVNEKQEKNVDRTMVTLDSWGGYPDSTFIEGNIFFTAETSRFQFTKSTNNYIEGNYYLGDFNEFPADQKAYRSSSNYMKEVLDKDRNGYKGLASLMDSVQIAAEVKGAFVNKNLIESFFLRIKENVSK